MQLGLPLWVGNNQAEELAHHWIRRNASMSDPGNCTVVEIAQQLLDSYACDNFFPYICMRQGEQFAVPPDIVVSRTMFPVVYAVYRHTMYARLEESRQVHLSLFT